MTGVIVHAQPFMFPTFLRLVIPGNEDTIGMNVGDAFPTDESAGAYWDELRDQWIQHCRLKRSQLGKSGEPR